MRLTFVETAAFRASAKGVLSDDDLGWLEKELLADPDAGEVIRGTGGARKIRVGLAGWGKRGAARVIYLHHAACDRVYFLLAYAKNVADDLSDVGRRAMRRTVEAIEREGC